MNVYGNYDSTYNETEKEEDQSYSEIVLSFILRLMLLKLTIKKVKIYGNGFDPQLPSKMCLSSYQNKMCLKMISYLQPDIYNFDCLQYILLKCMRY